MKYIYGFARKLIRWCILGITKKPSLQKRYPQYSIGRGSYGPLQVIDCGEGASLTIGSYTSIADGVKVILGCDHRTDWVSTFPFNVLWRSARQIEGHPRTKGDVEIGSDVWIATDALIMSGVKIGDGAVIGARAVVSKSVPPYSIVVGNPARVVKFRFDEQSVEQLLMIKWWEWDEARIENAMPLILNIGINEFIAAAKAGKI